MTNLWFAFQPKLLSESCFQTSLQLNNTPTFCLPIVPTSAAMATPSSGSSVSNGLYMPTGLANGDVKPIISSTPLADFLMQLEDYTPTVSSHLLNTNKYDFIFHLFVFVSHLDPRCSYGILSQSSRIWSIRSKDVSSAWFQFVKHNKNVQSLLTWMWWNPIRNLKNTKLCGTKWLSTYLLYTFLATNFRILKIAIQLVLHTFNYIFFSV